MDVTVSEPVAYFFYEQCAGESNGHMSMIPNNPVLSGLCKAHAIHTKEDFSRFLRQVADSLEKEQPF